MADFCSFCYCDDMDYGKIIEENYDGIMDILNEDKECYVKAGVCEGCDAVGIKIHPNLDVDLMIVEDFDTMKTEYQRIGKIEDKKIIVDESTEAFKKYYLKRKEMYDIN